MRISLIILLVVSVVRATDFYFYDIEYNHRYLLDTDRFPSNKIPIGTYYFRIPVENLQETNIKVQVKKEDITDFKMNVCGFYQFPTNSTILNGTNNIELEKDSVFNHDNLVTYEFKVPTLKKEEKIKYLLITISNNEVLDFLAVNVYSLKNDIRYGLSKKFKIKYMKEGVLNKTHLSKYIATYLFAFENEEVEKNKIFRLKFKKEYAPEIPISYYGCEEIPKTVDDLLLNSISSGNLKLKSLTRDEYYTKYEYLLEYSDKTKHKYLFFGLVITESLDFMTFYLGPES